MIDKTIGYVVYGVDNCPNCKEAVRILSEKGIDHQYVNARQDDEAFDMLISAGYREMPQIYKDNVRVGGLADLRAHLNG